MKIKEKEFDYYLAFFVTSCFLLIERLLNLLEYFIGDLFFEWSP